MPVGKYNILKITDTLPEGLKYIDGSIVVYKGNTQNKAVEGKDYTVTVNGNIVELTFASEFADEIIKEYGGKFQAFLNATVLNVTKQELLKLIKQYLPGILMNPHLMQLSALLNRP